MVCGAAAPQLVALTPTAPVSLSSTRSGFGALECVVRVDGKVSDVILDDASARLQPVVGVVEGFFFFLEIFLKKSPSTTRTTHFLFAMMRLWCGVEVSSRRMSGGWRLASLTARCRRSASSRAIVDVHTHCSELTK